MVPTEKLVETPDDKGTRATLDESREVVDRDGRKETVVDRRVDSAEDDKIVVRLFCTPDEGEEAVEPTALVAEVNETVTGTPDPDDKVGADNAPSDEEKIDKRETLACVLVLRLADCVL